MLNPQAVLYEEEQKRQDGLRKTKRPFRDTRLVSRQVFPFETRLTAPKK
jgi:hypothetical protein